MKKIIAFGASYSKNSINKKFASYAAEQFDNASIEILDLNDYPLPLFTVDVEVEIGLPKQINLFLKKIEEADLLIISMTEHNGNYAAAFKNLFDWVSRVKYKMFENKDILLISTSIGKRGGSRSLEIAEYQFPIHGANILEIFSLPEFETNFSPKKGITNPALNKHFQEVIAATTKKIFQ